MKKTIKKEGNEERPTLEVKTNGLPDLSLMPPEELNMLACGLDKIISKILKRNKYSGKGNQLNL